MPKSITSSYRIPVELKLRLDETAKHLNIGKNTLIMEALRTFLSQKGEEALNAELKRQSLLVNKHGERNPRDSEPLLEASDLGGWK